MPYMYILECSDGSYYTGSTWDLERRLWEHQNGLGAKHTAKHLPVKLVYCEECDRVEDAYAREKQIQGWSRKKKLALMAGDTNRLHQFAECRNGSHSRNLGFGSAQPTSSAQPTGSVQPTSSAQPTDFAQPTDPSRSLSKTDRSLSKTGRSLSGAEGSGLVLSEAEVAEGNIARQPPYSNPDERT